MVDLSLKMLLHDKLRFAITVSGVAFAVTLVLVQVGLFQGLMDNATVTIEHIDAEIWVTSKNTPNVDLSHAFPETRVQRVRAIPGVKHADNLIVAFANVQLPSGAEESSILYGLEDFVRWGIPWNVVDGNPDDLRRGRFAFFDASSVKRYGETKTGDYREVLGKRVRVLGHTRGAKSFTTTPITFVGYSLVQSMLPALQGNTTYILVKLEKGADVRTVQAQLRGLLPHNDVFTKAEWAQRSRSYWIDTTGIGLNMALTVFLGCLVGVVVVAQTLYTSTMEHIKEFGTVKAIGGSNLDIYRILVRQALLSAVVGFAIGSLPPLALAPLIRAKADLELMISPMFAAQVFVGTIVLCLTASAISFRKVSGIDPALVFRT